MERQISYLCLCSNQQGKYITFNNKRYVSVAEEIISIFHETRESNNYLISKFPTLITEQEFKTIKSNLFWICINKDITSVYESFKQQILAYSAENIFEHYIVGYKEHYKKIPKLESKSNIIYYGSELIWYSGMQYQYFKISNKIQMKQASTRIPIIDSAYIAIADEYYISEIELINLLTIWLVRGGHESLKSFIDEYIEFYKEITCGFKVIHDKLEKQKYELDRIIETLTTIAKGLVIVSVVVSFVRLIT